MNCFILVLIFVCSVDFIECQDDLSQTIYVYRHDVSKEPIELGKISNFKQNVTEYRMIGGTELQNKTFEFVRSTGKLTILRDAALSSPHTVTVQMKLASKGYSLTKLVVHIRLMSSEVIEKSGSFRITGITAEKFIESGSGENLREQLSNYLNGQKEKIRSCMEKMNEQLRIQIFSIVPKIDDDKTLDLRFTATAFNINLNETLNFVDQIHFILLENQKQIEENFEFKIVAVNINKCQSEENKCKSSCHNKITEIKPSNAIITNCHFFHGLDIIVKPVCECQSNLDSFNNVMKRNSGINIMNSCATIFPSIEPCENLSINLEFNPKSHTGMMIQFDSRQYNLIRGLKDFLSLELVNFKPQLIVNFGSEQTTITSNCSVTLSQSNTITIIIQQQNIELIIRNTSFSYCRTISKIKGNSKVLNIDAPIFFGKSPFNSNTSPDPQNRFLDGVITNLSINNFITNDLSFDIVEINRDKSSPQMVFILMCIIGVAAVILIVIFVMYIKHKISVSILMALYID